MKDGWILERDELPEEGTNVLVYAEHKMYGKDIYFQRDITIGKYGNGKWKCLSFLCNRVIAWKPLPEAPEGV